MDTIFDQLTLTRNEDGGYTVTACDKAAVSVTVPETVDGIPITAIGDGAFEDCVRLCEIFLPEAGELAFLDNMGLTKIGEYAFSGCKSLKRIELPESIGTVGRGAFHGCTAMTAAVLPQWVYLAPYAFSGCRALRKISPIKTVSEGLFRIAAKRWTTMPLSTAKAFAKSPCRAMFHVLGHWLSGAVSSWKRSFSLILTVGTVTTAIGKRMSRSMFPTPKRMPNACGKPISMTAEQGGINAETESKINSVG